MARKKPTVVSLFAGCGGSSLGYKLAGYRELLVIDFDKDCEKTFKANFPNVPYLREDIRVVSGEKILKTTGLMRGELDVLDASPPCQGYSMARGKRSVSDPRNDLFLHFVRLIKELEPKVFLMENVTGLTKGKMKGIFIEIMKTLKRLPYSVRCRKLNAANYGVPQNRRRLIWIGVKKDLGKEPVYPTPTGKIISVEEALNLKGFTEYSIRFNKGKPNKMRIEDFSNPAVTLTTNPDDKKHFIADPKLTDKYGKLWGLLKPGQNASCIMQKGFSSCVKLDPLKPSPTLPAQQSGSGFATLCHWLEERPLTIEEAKIIQSFPADFEVYGKYSIQWKQIGNSVPPKMMQAIAATIRKEILHA